MKKYTPPIPIEEYIDDYVGVIYQLIQHQVGNNSQPQVVKAKAYELIPDKPPMHPHTPRVIAAGAVFCAFILCDSYMSMEQFSLVSDRSSQLKYISYNSISAASKYIRDYYKLDIGW